MTRDADTARRQRSWRPDPLSWLIAAAGIVGVLALLYPAAAQWLSAHNQAQLIRGYTASLDVITPNLADQREAAHAYNRTLNAGATLAAHASIPEGTGAGVSHVDDLRYESMLRTTERGMMARIRYDVVGIDLPIFHGTSDATLLRGAGHLEGTHLPIGGIDTHSVITAHRGLATASMFTNLDRAEIGDLFSIEVLDEILAYEVTEIRIVEPHENQSLRVMPGKDLITLVTCTPIGINSHRILVTGERIIPTPAAVVETAGAPSEQPGPAWWLAALAGGTIVATWFLWSAGYRDSQARATAAAGASAPAMHKRESGKR